LPIFFLNETSTGKDSSAEGFSKSSSKRSWTLPGTKTGTTTRNRETRVIQETHFSLTICGLSDYEWSAYSFTDSEAEGPQDEGHKDHETDLEDDDNDDDDYELGHGDKIPYTEDRIVSDGQQDARYSRYPREQFLKPINVRLPWITNHYKDVCKVIETSVKETVSPDRPL
jgi:hypothetical protein